MTRRRTAFESDLESWSSDPAFRDEYDRARAQIDAVDQLIRAIDERRAMLGFSKSALARAAHSEPSVIRRLFTTPEANPTLSTMVDLAGVLGMRLTFVPDEEVTGASFVSSSRSKKGRSRKEAVA